MSIVRDILRTYRAPRDVQATRMQGPPREDRAMAVLFAGFFLIFIAQWPRLARESHFDPTIELNARLGAALFVWLMIMPLAFYVVSIVLTLILRAFGTGITGFQIRSALFWGLLASTPVWLFAGLLGGFAPGPGFTLVSTLALALVLVFAGAGLMTASAKRGDAL